MRFVGISNDDLGDLHRSLELFEQLYGRDEDSGFRPHLFILVNQGPLLPLAQQAIQEDGNFVEGEQAPQPSAIAVDLQLSSAVCHYLTGSGLYVGDAREDFAYMAGDEGIRTGSMAYAGGRERVNLNQIVSMAIATDSMYLDEFLQAHAPKTPGPTREEAERGAPKAVERTESVTQSSVAKGAAAKGIDKVLIAGKPIKELQVTEVIEIGDFIEDHKKGSYLHAETNGNEWLFFSNDPEEGRAAVERMLTLKLDLDTPPEVEILSYTEISALLEEVIDETE